VIDLGDGTFTHTSAPQIAGTLAQNPGARVVRRGLPESLAQRIALRMCRGGSELLDERFAGDGAEG
jgi:hypothetical protein